MKLSLPLIIFALVGLPSVALGSAASTGLRGSFNEEREDDSDDDDMECTVDPETGDEECTVTMYTEEIERSDGRQLVWIDTKEKSSRSKDKLCYKWRAERRFPRRANTYRANLCFAPEYNGAELISFNCQFYGSCPGDKNLGGYLTPWKEDWNGGCSLYSVNKKKGCSWDSMVKCTGIQCYFFYNG